MNPVRSAFRIAPAVFLLAVTSVAGADDGTPDYSKESRFRSAGVEPVVRPKAESSASITPIEFELYIERLEAVEAVKRLIASFAYFRSANLPDATADLFSKSATVDFDGGQWVGRESVRRLLHGRFRQEGLVGTIGPQAGVLNETYALQPVIDVAANGKSASARFREIEYLGRKGVDQHYGGMLYEAVFAIEDGGWVFHSLVPCQAWKTEYQADLSEAKLPVYPKPVPIRYPEVADGPDRYSSQICTPWPFGGITPPMHYPHPVTGEYINKP